MSPSPDTVDPKDIAPHVLVENTSILSALRRGELDIREAIEKRIITLTQTGEILIKMVEQTRGSVGLVNVFKTIARLITSEAMDSEEPDKEPSFELIPREDLEQQLMKLPLEEAVQLLCKPSVDDEDAATALMNIDEKRAVELIDALPGDRRAEFTVGRLSHDAAGILEKVSPEVLAQDILEQWYHDQATEDQNISDRNNMSAAYLLLQVLKERDDALVVLAYMDEDDLQAILSFPYSPDNEKKRFFKKGGGDFLSATEAQNELKDILNESFMEEIRKTWDRTQKEAPKKKPGHEKPKKVKPKPVVDTSPESTDLNKLKLK